MIKNMPVTEKEWEKLQNASFQVNDFVKALELFDSIRHVTGTSDFSERICADIEKVKDLVGKVFDGKQRDCVSELFFEVSSLDSIMQDMEDWITDIRDAFATLEEIKPYSLAEQDDTRTKRKKLL
jgi:hypothetical protein